MLVFDTVPFLFQTVASLRLEMWSDFLELVCLCSLSDFRFYIFPVKKKKNLATSMFLKQRVKVSFRTSLPLFPLYVRPQTAARLHLGPGVLDLLSEAVGTRYMWPFN